MVTTNPNKQRCGSSIATVLALVVALSGAPACSSDIEPGTRANASIPPGVSNHADGEPHRGGRLVIGVQQEPEQLSEILNATAVNNFIGNLLFARFVKYDSELNLVPDLIESVPTVENGGISPDYLTYTYTLRADALWHDGQPLTSADVVFTYEIIMDPEVNVESRDGWEVVESVDAPDEHTVVFHLSRPYPDFVAETFYDEPVLPKHILDSSRGPLFHTSKYHQAPVGSGPFKFAGWQRGSHLMLVANDEYFGEGPYLDEIVIKFVPNENSLLMQLKTGEIDVYDNANIEHLYQIDKMPGVTMYRTPSLMYEHLDLNTENPILSDRRVRQAIAMATNKRVISNVIYRGLARVAPLDEHPASRYFCSRAAAKARFDPATARRLLREAGWVDSDRDGILEKDGHRLELTLSAITGNRNRERTELLLQDQYREVGIDLQIKNYSSTVMYGSYEDGGVLKRGEFDMALYAWLSSPEPASKKALYAEESIPPNGQNHPRFRDERVSDLLERGSNETNPDERIELYRKVSDILVEESPVIPLFWYTTVDASTTRLRNYRPNPTQSADSWNANTWYLVN